MRERETQRERDTERERDREGGYRVGISDDYLGGGG